MMYITIQHFHSKT